MFGGTHPAPPSWGGFSSLGSQPAASERFQEGARNPNRSAGPADGNPSEYVPGQGPYMPSGESEDIVAKCQALRAQWGTVKNDDMLGALRRLSNSTAFGGSGSDPVGAPTSSGGSPNIPDLSGAEALLKATSDMPSNVDTYLARRGSAPAGDTSKLWGDMMSQNRLAPELAPRSTNSSSWMSHSGDGSNGGVGQFRSNFGATAGQGEDRSAEIAMIRAELESIRRDRDQARESLQQAERQLADLTSERERLLRSHEKLQQNVADRQQEVARSDGANADARAQLHDAERSLAERDSHVNDLINTTRQLLALIQGLQDNAGLSGGKIDDWQWQVARRAEEVVRQIEQKSARAQAPLTGSLVGGPRGSTPVKAWAGSSAYRSISPSPADMRAMSPSASASSRQWGGLQPSLSGTLQSSSPAGHQTWQTRF